MLHLRASGFQPRGSCLKPAQLGAGGRAHGCLQVRRRVHVCSGSDIRVKDFIAAECQLPGLDGRRRERARAATLETALLWHQDVLSPGCQVILPISLTALDQVIADGGQVLVTALALTAGAAGSREAGGSNSSAEPHPASPPAGGARGSVPLKSGSHAVLCQALGVQRMADRGALVRLEAQYRVVLQAVADGGLGDFRSQAALLPDRWAYFVRAGAVEQHLQNPPAILGGGGGGGVAAKEVVTAADSSQDAAQQVSDTLQAMLDQLRGPVARTAGDSSGAAEASGGSAADEREEAAAELERLLDWCSGAGAVDGGWSRMERLSYAPFAAEAVARAAGMPLDSLMKQRRRAMQATDMGLRFESALELAATLATRLRGTGTAHRAA